MVQRVTLHLKQRKTNSPLPSSPYAVHIKAVSIVDVVGGGVNQVRSVGLAAGI